VGAKGNYPIQGGKGGEGFREKQGQEYTDPPFCRNDFNSREERERKKLSKKIRQETHQWRSANPQLPWSNLKRGRRDS